MSDSNFDNELWLSVQELDALADWHPDTKLAEFLQCFQQVAIQHSEINKVQDAQSINEFLNSPVIYS